MNPINLKDNNKIYSLLETMSARNSYIYRFICNMGEYSSIISECYSSLRNDKFEKKEFLQQMVSIGFNSLPILILSCFFSGAVLSLYGSIFLIKYGATFLSGGTVGLAAAREMSAVMSGIIVISRCGSAITAQIGSMVVTEQIDALKTLGVNKYAYLILPRILASTCMLPVLSVVGFYSAIIGGALVAYNQGIPKSVYFDSIQRFLNPEDIHTGLVKAVIFGFIIALISCNEGLKSSGGARGVGQSTTRSVVLSIIWLYALNFVISKMLA